MDQYLQKLRLKGRMHPAMVAQLSDGHKNFVQHYKHIDMTKQMNIEEYIDSSTASLASRQTDRVTMYRSGVHYITKPEGTSAHTTLRQRKAKKSASVG